MLVRALVKWFQPWPYVPPIHLDKSCDPGIPPMFGKIGTCLDEAQGYDL